MSEHQPHDDHPVEQPRAVRRHPHGPGPGDHDPVEAWTLADEITRLPFSAWRMALVAWVDVARGVAATGPVWLGAWCLASLAAVRDLSTHEITAWPPYAAVIGILLIATWAGPSPRAPREAQQGQVHPRRARLRRRQPSVTTVTPAAPPVVTVALDASSHPGPDPEPVTG
jgi:hypothetical protein